MSTRAALLTRDEIAALPDEVRREYLDLLAKLPPRWDLWPRQRFARALTAKCDLTLYGGAAGGGKSELAVYHADDLAQRYPGHSSLTLRKTMPELMRSIIIRAVVRYYQMQVPAKRQKIEGVSAWWYAPDDRRRQSMSQYGFCRNDIDLAQYLSAEYDSLILDEGVLLSPDQLTQLIARVRCTEDKWIEGIRPHTLVLTNPGGPSHLFFLKNVLEPTDDGTRIAVLSIERGWDEAELIHTIDLPELPPGDPRDMPADSVDAVVAEVDAIDTEEWRADPAVVTVAFVASKMTDNPSLTVAARRQLNMIRDPLRRAQLRDGEWRVFEGQFFTNFSRATHVIDPFQPPVEWLRARGVDWGFGDAWCCLWGAWDHQGRLYVYREEYRTEVLTADQARVARDRSVWSDSDSGVEIPETFWQSVADPMCFQINRVGMGRAIADVWREHGFHTTPAMNKRVPGWQIVRAYLDTSPDDGLPWMLISRDCPHVIEQLESAPRSPTDPEDVDASSEDHALDALRYLCAARPIRKMRTTERMLVGMEGALARYRERKQRAQARYDRRNEVWERMRHS